MADKVQGSYLFELKPYVDKEKWASASGDIESAIKSSRKVSYDEWKGRREALAAEVENASKIKGEIENLRAAMAGASGERLAAIRKRLGITVDENGNEQKTGDGLYEELAKAIERVSEKRAAYEGGGSPGKMQMFAGKMGGFVGWLSKASVAIGIFYEAMKKAITGAIELVDSQKEMANKLNAMGSFGNMGTRDLMARYGISSNRAVAMSTTLEMMGLSESDIGRMTKKQRDSYNELISYYEAGINRIDKRKLEEYYDTMEDFQMKQAKWKMDLQTTILRMVAESDGFKKLVENVEKFFDNTIKFLNSPVVKWLFDTLSYFLAEVTDIAANTIGLFSFGGSRPSTSNSVTSNATNNYYIYGSENSSSEEIAKKVALRQSTPSYY